MPRALSAEELAEECGVAVERVAWLAEVGILKPIQPGQYVAGDAYRVKMVEVFLRAGFTRAQIEQGVAAGILNLDLLDRYFEEPSPRAGRSFAEFCRSIGPAGRALPSVYEAMGLASPDPAGPVTTLEEDLLAEFLAGWRHAPNEEVLLRAARMIGEASRLVALGWRDLFQEQISGPAGERFMRGEPLSREESTSLAAAGASLVHLAPRMVTWLSQQILEEALSGAASEEFERFMASRGLVPPPPEVGPAAVAFVDLSGFTSTTEVRGDEAAVRFGAILQDCASKVAATNGGRLVKLLGDGAMLYFSRAPGALEAAVKLVGELREATGLDAHAGIHAGTVMERDRDVFGRTVNIASRVSNVARAREVLVTEAAFEAAGAPAAFELLGPMRLKGLSEDVVLYRTVVDFP